MTNADLKEFLTSPDISDLLEQGDYLSVFHLWRQECLRIGGWAYTDCAMLGEFLLLDAKVDFLSYCDIVPMICFCKSSRIRSISIPEGVEVIERMAFCRCSNLECVSIPDSITCICYNAFSGCTSLSSVFIPDSVIDIDATAFRDCENTIIECHKESFAEKYCKDRGLKYKIVD